MVNMMNVDNSKIELSILAVEAENYKSQGRMIIVVCLLVHLLLGYALTILIVFICVRAGMAASDLEFPSQLSILPLRQRYEDMRAFDGVSHISLLVNVFSSSLCGLLGGLAVVAQYVRKVYLPGKYAVIRVQNVVRSLCFVVAGVFLFWLVFVFDYRFSTRVYVSKAFLCTWPIFPVMSIANLIVFAAVPTVVVALFLKWRVGAIVRGEDA